MLYENFQDRAALLAAFSTCAAKLHATLFAADKYSNGIERTKQAENERKEICANMGKDARK